MIYRYAGTPTQSHGNIRESGGEIMANRQIDDPGLTLLDRFDGAVNVGAGGIRRRERLFWECETISLGSDAGSEWNAAPVAESGRGNASGSGLFGRCLILAGMGLVAHMLGGMLGGMFGGLFGGSGDAVSELALPEIPDAEPGAFSLGSEWGGDADANDEWNWE